jgi:hypothetical protein
MRAPVPLARYGLVIALAIGGLLLVTLLVRPFIFTFSEARDDTRYPLIATAEADAGPRLLEIVLNEPHGLLGERVRDEAAGLRVVVAPRSAGDGYTVVSAWSPVNDCGVTLAADRLVDCDGAAWTFDGVPLDPADPPLQRFPATERNGAVVVDFTRPDPSTAP